LPDGVVVGLALRLGRVRWSDEEAAGLARAATSPGVDLTRCLRSLFEFIDAQAKSGKHLEAFLAAFLNTDAPHLAEDFRRGAASALVTLVERRVAIDELPDPAADPAAVGRGRWTTAASAGLPPQAS